MRLLLLLLVCVARAEQALGQEQGGSRLILKNSDDPSEPCEGHVKIYRNGVWGYAGDEGWKAATEEVVCRSALCGKPVSCSTENTPILKGSKVWLNEMDCAGNESHLWSCSSPGWGVSVYRKDTVKNIKCSSRISMSLEGFRCAGAVRYSIDGQPPGYFCADNWGRGEADRLCESLQCGKAKDLPQQEWMVLNGFETAEKVRIQCSGIENEINHLWQCVTEGSATCTRAAFVECEGHERLQLSGNTSNVCSGMLERDSNGKWERANISSSSDAWCSQLNCGSKSTQNQAAGGTELTCTDRVGVQLTLDGKNPTKCYGKVSVRVNGSSHPVCAADWDAEDGEVVCRELNCGKVIAAEEQSAAVTGIMDNVNCSGSEASLWHCRAKRGSKPLQCSSVAYVVCEKSLDVRLTDGPGRCAGRVEIQFKGGWMQVKSQGWTPNNSNSVCRQLQCGDKRPTAEAEKFTQGSGVFFPKTVDCQTGTSRISDCITDKSANSQRDEEAVGVTCEEHKVLFLHGNGHVCSGMVGIEQGTRTYWLSGSNDTLNQDTANLACRQKHCGSVRNFTAVSNADTKKDVWKKSLKCSSEHKSLFECEENGAAPDYNATIASVTCSGEITVTLSNGCWGHVNVTVDGTSGGVCADAWTETQSLMLCEDLGCGDRILAPKSPVAGINIILKSLHATNQTTKLSQCNVVKNVENGNSCRNGPAYVVCSGSVETRLRDSRATCSGNVEVSYERRWLPVCKDALNDSAIQSAICQELRCGQTGGTMDYFGPAPPGGVVISELKCANGGKGLKACGISAKRSSCALAGLQCFKWNKVTLSDSCRGAVIKYSKDGRTPVSVKDWTPVDGNTFCKNLNCGNFLAINSSQESCALEQAPNVTREQQALIECQEKPTVSLSGNCNGAVTINQIQVCNTNWNDEYSHLVCHEQECSNAIPGLTMEKEPKPNGEYYHVMCEDYHHKLGQCKRYKGKCHGKLVSVSCVKSVQFRTSHPCGGLIQVNYQDGKWEGVCPAQAPGFLQKLCRLIGCGEHLGSITSNKQAAKKQADLRTRLEYSEDHVDIRHSVRVQACPDSKPSEIFCFGYVPQVPPDQTPPIQIVPILLGVGVALIVVIVVSAFVRIKIKRARKSKAAAAPTLSRRDVEFESGEFADLKEDEMENFNHGRFRPEAGVTMDNDRRSASSFPYDDIDEVTESRPLTAAGASGGSYLHEDQTDGVTYEVEDPQESYDDIDAGPELSQTKAEVHDGPQPGSPASASQPLRQEEDYVLPGQDG